jgi:hypothetical protein
MVGWTGVSSVKQLRQIGLHLPWLLLTHPHPRWRRTWPGAAVHRSAALALSLLGLRSGQCCDVAARLGPRPRHLVAGKLRLRAGVYQALSGGRSLGGPPGGTVSWFRFGWRWAAGSYYRYRANCSREPGPSAHHRALPGVVIPRPARVGCPSRRCREFRSQALAAEIAGCGVMSRRTSLHHPDATPDRTRCVRSSA